MSMNTTQPTGSLAGRRILVTGAARGLGFAFAQTLCTQGAQVVLADLREELLVQAVEQLRAKGLQAHGVAFDASKPDSIAHCAHQAVQALGGLDGLVNNALEKWDQVMSVNVRGVWLMTRACRAALRDSGRGAVVNLASDTALWGAPNLMAYVASKGAVMAMTHAMAREMGGDNVTVNAVAPGLVPVEATEYVPEHRHRLYIDQRALQREQGPEDVSGAVSYLLSDGARFVTGQVLPVNGGFVMN